MKDDNYIFIFLKNNWIFANGELPKITMNLMYFAVDDIYILQLTAVSIF